MTRSAWRKRIESSELVNHRSPKAIFVYWIPQVYLGEFGFQSFAWICFCCCQEQLRSWNYCRDSVLLSWTSTVRSHRWTLKAFTPWESKTKVKGMCFWIWEILNGYLWKINEEILLFPIEGNQMNEKLHIVLFLLIEVWLIVQYIQYL